MNEKRIVPIGVQSFEDLRKKKFLYVDKTEWVWSLVNGYKVYFLSRPRRFGKSLFLSTLAAYFRGQKELFKGLKLETLEDAEKNTREIWQEYPVLYLDFNPKNYADKQAIFDILDFHFREWEAMFNIPKNETSADGRFFEIIKTIYKTVGKQVVILVDEYDKPLLETMNENDELYETYRKILKGFYGVLKSCDAYIRFAFLTGVTKFSKISIFSDLNNLLDISLEKSYAEICGITQEELEANFMPEIKALAENCSLTEKAALERLKETYDGYLFHQNGKPVYNPLSLINAFASREFGYYWFATGTPTFLIDLLKGGDYDLRDITEEAEMSKESLFDYRPDAENPIPVFFQAGYLTIKSYDTEFGVYKMGFPNKEVRQGFFNNLAPAFTGITKDETGFYIKNFITDIREGKVGAFMKRMYAACEGIPYSTAAKKNGAVRERDYQIAFYIIFTLMGYYAETEVHSHKGRADLVLRTADTVYVFEFKTDGTGSPDEAILQIKEKGYAEKYKMSGKRLILIGAVFGDDITEKTSDIWKAEEIQ
ncbi:ATP-binding protein [Treponema pedis]|uniref:ATPase AAA n=1 Tax=Treponema pedis str. T A4 TaxID=1291379 RepID=S6A4G5_9SPIR|nr:ATP-binding protein [Treponema pedis]AGT44421.1 ATPase AAA [Treponema pedis str. T A4]